MGFDTCLSCLHRNSSECTYCVGWNRYETRVRNSSDKSTDISKEMALLAHHYYHHYYEGALKGGNNMKIKKVIFNYPATVVLWEDGTKTIVKCGDYDVYDPEKGLAMAIAKKAFGNQGNYYEVFKEWLPDYEVKQKHITPVGTVYGPNASGYITKD